MNIIEADQTYFLISRTNSRFDAVFIIEFLTAKSFHFRDQKLPLHMVLKVKNLHPVVIYNAMVYCA